MKLAISLNKKGINVIIVDIRKNSSSTLVKNANDLVLKFIGNIQL